ncbi:MAG: fasciclin domain-containing protein, partial [Acidimicrobiia bacterium]
MKTLTRNLRLVALVAMLALVLAACGGNETADTTTTTVAPTTTEAMDDMGDLTAVNFGAACAAVPADGEGSFDGMADDPAATAASNNPVLSTLVTAVVEAGLVDTLNSEGPFTIFAPYNDAFAAIPAEDLEAILADIDLLTSILTFHVVAGESLDAQALVDAGSVTTVNGADLTIAASGETITVNGASVICGNVQTANATVHIIDAVLVPEMEEAMDDMGDLTAVNFGAAC